MKSRDPKIRQSPRTKVARKLTPKAEISPLSKTEDYRRRPEKYRVGRGEQGVLTVEPYRSEILPFWKFRTPADARHSSRKIQSLFAEYKRNRDFVGMDMARKFLQMGFTRSRRYANHASGRKYDSKGRLLPVVLDEEKALSAEIFRKVWKKVEADSLYMKLKTQHKELYG